MTNKLNPAEHISHSDGNDMNYRHEWLHLLMDRFTGISQHYSHFTMLNIKKGIRVQSVNPYSDQFLNVRYCVVFLVHPKMYIWLYLFHSMCTYSVLT